MGVLSRVLEEGHDTWEGRPPWVVHQVGVLGPCGHRGEVLSWGDLCPWEDGREVGL